MSGARQEDTRSWERPVDIHGPVVLGLDIGTGSTKAVLVSAHGRVVARAQREHRTATPRTGWFEHDPESVWWADVVDVMGRLGEVVPLSNVAGVTVSGIGPVVAPADGDGRPLRPAILYGVDTRAVGLIPEIEAQLDTGAHERTGSPLTSQAAGPKLLWLARNEPDVWRRTRYFFMASSFVAYQLTGSYVLDHHSASQCTPMYDLRRGCWDEQGCEAVAPGLPLPRLAWPGEVVGEVTRDAAAATGLPVGTPVTAGTIDAWAESVSVGAYEPGDLMVMYGTTMFLVTYGKSPLASDRLWGTAGVFPDTYCLAAGMATSGSVTGWLAELTDQSYETLYDEAADVSPGSDGLLVLPYFAGERTPRFDPEARGVVAGLTLGHGRGHLFRAVLEATAFGVRHNIEAMCDAGAEPRRLVAVGGGAQGDLWLRIVSAVTGRPQEVPAETVGASYGDAFLAATALGWSPTIDNWNPVDRVVEPDPDLAGVYGDRYDLYLDLYERTRDPVHALARSAER